MDPGQREARFLEQAGRSSKTWSGRARLSLVVAAFFGLYALYGLARLFFAEDEGDVMVALAPLLTGLGLAAWQLTLRTHYQMLEGAAMHLERQKIPPA